MQIDLFVLYRICVYSKVSINKLVIVLDKRIKIKEVKIKQPKQHPKDITSIVTAAAAAAVVVVVVVAIIVS